MMRPFPLACCLLSAIAGLTFGAEEAKTKSDSRYTHGKAHRDGIGKFYMGREIAKVMSFHGASWLDRPTREKQEKPSKLYESLKIQAGDKVADIGAGSGYHTFRLSKYVGKKGKVYAVDIQPQMLAIIKRRMKQRDIENIVLVKGTIDDPKLPKHSLDLILMVDVYHEFSHPYEMTRELVKALKPGGRLVFVEFRLEDPNVPIKRLHCMSKKQVRKEMQPHPVRHKQTLNHLPWQHVIIFEKVEKDSQ